GRDTQWSLDAFFVRNEPGPGGAGKIDFWRHERIPLHPKLLTHVRLVRVVEDALLYAGDDRGSTQGVVQQLVRAAQLFARYVRFPAEYNLTRNDWADVRALAGSIEALPRFWAKLEEPFYKLLGALA